MVCYYKVTPLTTGLACILQCFRSFICTQTSLQTQSNDFSIFSRAALVWTWPQCAKNWTSHLRRLSHNTAFSHSLWLQKAFTSKLQTHFLTDLFTCWNVCYLVSNISVTIGGRSTCRVWHAHFVFNCMLKKPCCLCFLWERGKGRIDLFLDEIIWVVQHEVQNVSVGSMTVSDQQLRIVCSGERCVLICTLPPQQHNWEGFYWPCSQPRKWLSVFLQIVQSQRDKIVVEIC